LQVIVVMEFIEWLEGSTLGVVEEREFRCVPDSSLTFLTAKETVEEVSQVFGPVFKNMVARYALEFEVEKLGCEKPEGVETFEEVSDFIAKNLDKYPDGFCALIYGMLKAERLLQGGTGAGARSAAIDAIRNVIKKSGLLDEIVGSTKDPYEAMLKAGEIYEKLNVESPIKVRKLADGSVEVVALDCPYADACKRAVREGIRRMIGNVECIELILDWATIEIVTEEKFDYSLEHYDPPRCSGKLFRV